VRGAVHSIDLCALPTLPMPSLPTPSGLTGTGLSTSQANNEWDKSKGQPAAQGFTACTGWARGLVRARRAMERREGGEELKWTFQAVRLGKP
jgi:hypothetical protein